MEREEIHDLTGAYALDALGPDDERAFEEHLRHCQRCRAEVAALLETAADLAHATPGASPSPALRAKVLAQVQTERGNLTPLRPRWAMPVAVAAAVAACAAVALGVWAASLHGRLDDRTSALRQRDRVLAVLRDPGAQRVALAGGRGALYVGDGGRAALVLAKLPAAPAGKRYEVWVIAGKAAKPAGLFGGGPSSAVALAASVASGNRVGVTLEPAGGSPRPTGRILALSAPVSL